MKLNEFLSTVADDEMVILWNSTSSFPMWNGSKKEVPIPYLERNVRKNSRYGNVVCVYVEFGTID